MKWKREQYMHVKIRQDDPDCGIKAGEVYRATRYALDPREKVTLYNLDGEAICNQYFDNVDIVSFPNAS